jgi:hypothetical protein
MRKVRRIQPSASPTIVKDFAFMAFCLIRRVVGKARHSPAYLQRLKGDIREAWEDSGRSGAVIPASTDKPPF